MANRQQEFDEIYEQHKALVAAYLRLKIKCPQDQEEVFQDVFLEFFQLLKKRRPSHHRAYLLKMARNKVSKLHAKKSQPLTFEEEPSRSAALTGDVKLALESAIRSLSPDLQEVFLMKHKLGLRYDEMSQVLGIPRGTVSSRLHESVTQLKIALKKAGLHTRVGESA